MAKDLDSYYWSSHKGYLSRANKWKWLYKDFVLSMLTHNKKFQRRIYKLYIEGEDSEEISTIFSKGKLPSILGNESFIEWTKDRFFSQKKHIEVPESKSLAPDREKIKRFVCKSYKVRDEELVKSIRGCLNEPRNVAIYLTRVLRGDGLSEICREYQLSKHSSASSVIEKVRKQMSKDNQFRRRVENLGTMLSKSQSET